MLSSELIREKLKKEEEKKAKIEANIKTLKNKLEQAEMSEIKATMQEYNVSIADLKEFIKRRNGADNNHE